MFYFNRKRTFSKKFTNAGYHAKEHEKMYQKAIVLRFKMLICVWCQSCPCLNSSTWSSVNPKKFSDMMETSFLFTLKVEVLYFHQNACHRLNRNDPRRGQRKLDNSFTHKLTFLLAELHFKAIWTNICMAFNFYPVTSLSLGLQTLSCTD